MIDDVDPNRTNIVPLSPRCLASSPRPRLWSHPLRAERLALHRPKSVWRTTSSIYLSTCSDQLMASLPRSDPWVVFTVKGQSHLAYSWRFLIFCEPKEIAPWCHISAEGRSTGETTSLRNRRLFGSAWIRCVDYRVRYSCWTVTRPGWFWETLDNST